MQLFERSRQGHNLTPAGHELGVYAEEMESAALAAETSFLSTSAREIDFAVHLARPSTGHLIVRKLADYTLRLYGARSYVAAHPPIAVEKDLQGHTFLGYIDDFIYAPELRYLESAIKSEKPKIKSSSLVAQINATLASVGLCIVPCFMAHEWPELVEVLPEQVEIERTFWLIYPKNLQNVARIRAFADFLIDIVATDRGVMRGGPPISEAKLYAHRARLSCCQSVRRYE